MHNIMRSFEVLILNKHLECNLVIQKVGNSQLRLSDSTKFEPGTVFKNAKTYIAEHRDTKASSPNRSNQSKYS